MHPEQAVDLKISTFFFNIWCLCTLPRCYIM